MNKYIIIFLICSFAGWIWETIFCTVCQKKWANRGFLYGPICPIYGYGGVFFFAIHKLCEAGKIPYLTWWQAFIVGFAVSMILEYPTSYLLEKFFHARWWDYSEVPMNINGRTSVPTSIAFGSASTVALLFIMPHLSHFVSSIPELVTNLLSLLITALIAVDTTLTISALTDFQKHIAELDTSFQNHLTDAVTHIFSVNNSFKLKAIKRIVDYKFPPSEKTNDEMKKITEWFKNLK